MALLSRWGVLVIRFGSTVTCKNVSTLNFASLSCRNLGKAMYQTTTMEVITAIQTNIAEVKAAGIETAKASKRVATANMAVTALAMALNSLWTTGAGQQELN